MNSAHRPMVRTQGIVVQETPDEVLLYDTDSSRAHALNATAASVWKAADGTKSVAEIAAALRGVAGADASLDEGVVWLALEQLEENGLMQTSVDWAQRGTSRRDLIRHIGLAAAVALPIVASLAVPNHAAAQSCSCVNPGSCLTQTGCPSTVNCNGSAICAP